MSWMGRAACDDPGDQAKLEQRHLRAGAPSLPWREVDSGDRSGLWWVGVHGGAGESVLEALIKGSRAAGHAWPVARDFSALPVVLVARTHARGLAAAEGALREWETAEVQVRLLGLVLVADAPGRLPGGLARRVEELRGRVEIWEVPWVEQWRVGEKPSRALAPRAARRMLDDLQAMVRQ